MKFASLIPKLCSVSHGSILTHVGPSKPQPTPLQVRREPQATFEPKEGAKGIERVGQGRRSASCPPSRKRAQGHRHGPARLRAARCRRRGPRPAGGESPRRSPPACQNCVGCQALRKLVEITFHAGPGGVKGAAPVEPVGGLGPWGEAGHTQVPEGCGRGLGPPRLTHRPAPISAALQPRELQVPAADAGERLRRVPLAALPLPRQPGPGQAGLPAGYQPAPVRAVLVAQERDPAAALRHRAAPAPHAQRARRRGPAERPEAARAPRPRPSPAPASCPAPRTAAPRPATRSGCSGASGWTRALG